MSELISNISFVVFGVLTVMIAVVMIKVLREGPREIRRLRRAGYGVSNLIRPELPKDTTGAMDVEKIAAGLSERDSELVSARGLAFGRAPFSASIMRHLVRRGLFNRVEFAGFQTKWELTALGLAVRAILEKQS